jgi:hypothetical protein
MLDAFFGKYSKDQRKDLSEIHGILWEGDESVSKCRDCEATFTVSLRKHHCRGCGGIFCENCTDPHVSLHAGEEPVRACSGCTRGETPGPEVVKLVETVLGKRAQEAKGSGTAATTFPPSTSIRMHTGSLYGDDESRSVRLDGTAAHKCKYFEIVNKSSEMLAVRLLESGGDAVRELCRPCYLAGEWGQSVCGGVHLCVWQDVNVIVDDVDVNMNVNVLF